MSVENKARVYLKTTHGVTELGFLTDSVVKDMVGFAHSMCEEQKKEDKSFIVGYLSAVNPDLANTFDLTTKNVCDE